jgi:hypothetical protein
MAARLGVALVLTLLCASVAQAQQYQRLHVRSFTLSSDIARPNLEQPFHVTLAIHVSENVPHLENVFLPTFFGAEELGDEQQTTRGSRGTTYRETLTLVAHERGDLSISPAYLDAIDARDGKPKRFISNGLTLAVGGGAVSAVWSTLRAIVIVLIDVLLIAAALFVLAVLFWRRRRTAVVVQPPAPLAVEPPPVAAQQPRHEVAEALAQLRERRDRASVLNLRAALWHEAGASTGETLSDVLRRPRAGDANLRRLLMVVERAAFIEQERLSAAIDEVLSEREWTFV